MKNEFEKAVKSWNVAIKVEDAQEVLTAVAKLPDGYEADLISATTAIPLKHVIKILYHCMNEGWAYYSQGKYKMDEECWLRDILEDSD